VTSTSAATTATRSDRRRRRLRLDWSRAHGDEQLRIRGWRDPDLVWLRSASEEELRRRLAVLATDLVEATRTVRALPQVAGRFEIDGDEVRFVPRFPFIASTSYSVLISPAAGGEHNASGAECWTIARPAYSGTPARVLAIYPGAGELPLNNLKLYVKFSKPMSEGWAAPAVCFLRPPDNEPIEGVLLPMDPELWDTERRRLTLLLDPGRIKRGLAPNREAGYPLVEGWQISVRVERTFRDAHGRPLRAAAERGYMVGPAVRKRVDPAEWRYRWPAAGSMEPLLVGFDRPLDRALLEHCLSVVDEAGAPVIGRQSIGGGERWWRFSPTSPWRSGRYGLDIDCRLEDLAGNSVNRVFDRDLTLDEHDPLSRAHVQLEFSCDRPASTQPRASDEALYRPACQLRIMRR